MAFNLKQNPVMIMGKHTSCQFSAACPLYNLSSSHQISRNYLLKTFVFYSTKFSHRPDRLEPRFRDKDLESRRKEFMRTLIKNPTKLLIILERSNGERSIPEMDKVLDRFEAISKWTRKSHILFRRNYSQVKWLVPHTMTVMELARLLKQRLKVAPRIDILLLVRHETSLN